MRRSLDAGRAKVWVTSKVRVERIVRRGPVREAMYVDVGERVEGDVAGMVSCEK